MPYADRELGKAKMRQRYADRKEQYRAYNQAHRQERIMLARKTNLKKLYGLTLGEYDAMFAAQKGLCAICHETSTWRLGVDHDHGTGKIRELLCNRCNFGLGKFRDSPELLHEAIRYLVRHAH